MAIYQGICLFHLIIVDDTSCTSRDIDIITVMTTFEYHSPIHDFIHTLVLFGLVLYVWNVGEPK